MTPDLCQIKGCKEPAVIEAWGHYFEARGKFCWDHGRKVVGCTCVTCEEQSAWKRIKEEPR